MKEIDLNKLGKWDKNYIPVLQLYGTEIERLVSPCVYGWQRGNEWLYIGFSNNGLSRVIGLHHHVINTYDVYADDNFYIWQPENKTVGELKALEQTLILLFQPRYNQTWVARPSKKGLKKSIARSAKMKDKAEEAACLLKLVEDGE